MFERFQSLKSWKMPFKKTKATFTESIYCAAKAATQGIGIKTTSATQ